jgi:predicted N-acetyltransferase YhbS
VHAVRCRLPGTDLLADSLYAIAKVIAAAFEREDEVRLVEAIRTSDSCVRELALVAEQIRRSLASYLALHGTAAMCVLALASMAVAPIRQRRGSSSALVEAGH